MDPLTIVISGGIGVATGALILYAIMRSGRKEVKETKEKRTFPIESDIKRLVDKDNMEKARRDLNAILLEKDLISSALTRVYEAEVEGRISKQEREELATRYKERLKQVEENLGDTEITIEVGELERLREELVSLFERKMQHIDDRLQDARAKLEKMRKIGEQTKTFENLEKKEKIKKPKSKIEETEVDQKVNSLREEVLEALARLEQMDIEG